MPCKKADGILATSSMLCNGFSIKQGFMGKVSEQAVIQKMQVLHEQVKFPGETFLICLDLVENKALHKKMKKLPNAVILHR